MLEPLEDIDIDSFLQEETEAWCVSQLTEMGFFNEELNNYQRPFITSYINLRQRIQDHQESGQLPILQLSPVPLGGAQRFV